MPRAAEIHIDVRVLLFALASALLCGLSFGLAPVLRLPLRSLEKTLRAGGRTTAGNSRRHSPFVIAEIALAFVLLLSAAMLSRTLLTLSSLNPGFDPHNVLAARFALSPTVLRDPAQIQSAWRDVLDQARRLPGVESAALADIIPTREGENALPYRTTPNPLPPNQEPFALATSVTPGYLAVMRIPLRAGRFLNHQDQANTRPASSSTKISPAMPSAVKMSSASISGFPVWAMRRSK